jgi:hypothetical protein
MHSLKDHKKSMVNDIDVDNLVRDRTVSDEVRFTRMFFHDLGRLIHNFNDLDNAYKHQVNALEKNDSKKYISLVNGEESKAFNEVRAIFNNLYGAYSRLVPEIAGEVSHKRETVNKATYNETIIALVGISFTTIVVVFVATKYPGLGRTLYNSKEELYATAMAVIGTSLVGRYFNIAKWGFLRLIRWA